MKRLFANLMVVCVLCFACVALAQENEAPARGVVATTEEQLAALNAMDDFQLASHIDSLTGSQVAQQVMILNDGNHAILLARVLVTVKALIPTWGENKQTEVAQIVNTDTTNIRISNETRPDVQIEVSTVNGKILVGDRNVIPPTAAAITAAAEQKVQQEAAAAQAAQAAAAAAEGQAAAGEGQAAAGEGQAAAAEGQAAAGEGQAAAGEGQAAAGEGQAAAGEGQAAAGEGQAAAGEGQAAAGEGQAAAGQAAAGEGQAAAGEGQAAAGDAATSVAGAGTGTVAGTGGINVRNSPMTNPVSTAGNNPVAPANPESTTTPTETISPYASENTSTNSESPFQLQQ